MALGFKLLFCLDWGEEPGCPLLLKGAAHLAPKPPLPG